MSAEDIVNLIIKKLGGNRVKFTRIVSFDSIATVEFVHVGKCYSIIHPEDDSKVVVWKFERDQGPLLQNNYTRWVEGVLNGMVRNDNGDLVEP